MIQCFMLRIPVLFLILLINLFYFDLKFSQRAMSIKYIHIRKPPRNFLQKRKDFSRQGFLLSKQTENSNHHSYQQKKAEHKLDSSNFESIFDYLYPNLTKRTAKSEGRFFKSAPQSEINQMKSKMQEETQKRQQKRLNFLLNGRIQQFTERTPNSFQKNPSKILYPNPNPSMQPKQTQKKPENNLKQGKQRKFLESTNFSIQPTLTQSQERTQGYNKLNSSSNLTKRPEFRTSFKSYFSPNQKTNRQKSLQKTSKQILQHGEIQMDITLSIKSMSRSQQGEGQVLQYGNQINLNEAQTNDNLQKKNKLFFTPKNKKCNHLLIRFDKRLLLSASRINDPCMRIERIKSISSRIQTEPNF